MYRMWYVRSFLFRSGYIPCGRGNGDGYGTVTLPYEFLPLPEVGTKAWHSDEMEKVCEAEVTARTAKAFDHTNLLTIKVPNDMTMKARFYKKRSEEVRL